MPAGHAGVPSQPCFKELTAANSIFAAAYYILKYLVPRSQFNNIVGRNGELVSSLGSLFLCCQVNGASEGDFSQCCVQLTCRQ